MESPRELEVFRALRTFVEERFPGCVVEGIERLGADPDGDRTERTTEKRLGYGETLRVLVQERDGQRRDLVFHTATDNDFGHDRRSDRARSMLLDYDTFDGIPRHARPIDVGAICRDGSLRSVADCGEFYLLTEYVDGAPYARDLRRIAKEARLAERDRQRCAAMARYLAMLHRQPAEARPGRYTRSVRDLLGDGEGIFGIIDGYAPDVEKAPPERLQSIETRCLEWRWRLRGEGRLRTIHGDFHPFNVLFNDQDELYLLDASRGCAGDPADDVTCMALNFVFFALEQPGAWQGGLGELWRRFWQRYLALTGDLELFEVAPPYWTWRTLVLANPRWYPGLAPASRDRLLTFAEEVLDEGVLRPERVQVLFG